MGKTLSIRIDDGELFRCYWCMELEDYDSTVKQCKWCKMNCCLQCSKGKINGHEGNWPNACSACVALCKGREPCSYKDMRERLRGE